MRFLIMLEQTEAGFAVQVPDLAVTTFGTDIESAKRVAAEAIRINLDAYREAGVAAFGESRVPRPAVCVR